MLVFYHPHIHEEYQSPENKKNKNNKNKEHKKLAVVRLRDKERKHRVGLSRRLRIEMFWYENEVNTNHPYDSLYFCCSSLGVFGIIWTISTPWVKIAKASRIFSAWSYELCRDLLGGGVLVITVDKVPVSTIATYGWTWSLPHCKHPFPSRFYSYLDWLQIKLNLNVKRETWPTFVIVADRCRWCNQTNSIAKARARRARFNLWSNSVNCIMRWRLTNTWICFEQIAWESPNLSLNVS